MKWPQLLKGFEVIQDPFKTYLNTEALGCKLKRVFGKGFVFDILGLFVCSIGRLLSALDFFLIIIFVYIEMTDRLRL